MNRRIRILFALLALLASSVSLLSAPVCPFTAIRKLLAVAKGATEFYSKIESRVKADALKYFGNSRWSHLSGTVDEKILQIHLDMEASLSTAVEKSTVDMFDEKEALWIRDKASAAYGDLLTDEAVLASQVSFEDIGEAYGSMAKQISKRLGEAKVDQKLAEIITKNKELFLQNYYKDVYARYNLPELMRDAKYVLGDEGNPVVCSEYLVNLASGSPGLPFELRVAAAKKGAGHKIIHLDADRALTPGGGVPYPKTDIVTDRECINIALTKARLKGKLGSVDERAQIVSAIIAAETGTPVRTYRFVISGGDGDLTAELELLNRELVAKNHRQFSFADIEVVELK